ncbi:MAG: DNA mismatch repair protein MutS [Rickettsiaceae bacterium]
MDITKFRELYDYEKASSVIKQFLDIKFEYFECLILFRIGDFYELFYEDAHVASKVLNIVLTCKKTKYADIPMCGIPHHALSNNLKKLVDEGHKVAICDQVETAKEAKIRDGLKSVLVKREVTRIITPGTILEESLLDSGEPNYLASIINSKNSGDKIAICYVDISISEIYIVETNKDSILEELSRISAKEILAIKSNITNEIDELINHTNFKVTYLDENLYKNLVGIILDYYKIFSLKAIGDLSDIQAYALAHIIGYLQHTQRENLHSLPLPKIVNHSSYMHIDRASRRNLELVRTLSNDKNGSLLNAIDKTITKAGSRLLYQFLCSPLRDIELINSRLNITELFYKNHDLTYKIRELLKGSSDIARYLTKIATNKSTPFDLLGIKHSLYITSSIKQLLISAFGINMPDSIEDLYNSLLYDQEIYDLINNAIKENISHKFSDGVIKNNYHPKIKELNELISNSKKYIQKLQIKYQEEVLVNNLRISHNNIIGLFIEVSLKDSANMEHSCFIHKQTTGNYVRYTTCELQSLESKMVNAKALMVNLEQELYKDICRQILNKENILHSLANSLAELDVFCNFGYIAYKYDYTKPIISDQISFEVLNGRHPVIEQIHAPFVANNCQMQDDSRIWLLTGPNMSGKSTFLRQNALIAIMAHIGSFVPANSTQIGIIDKIFSRIGYSDDLLNKQSTFMVEMLEMSTILSQATRNSMVIIDEIGRGTSTYDGIAIASSILRYLHDKISCRCLFSTHYHELTALSKSLSMIRNYTIAICEENDQITFLYKIQDDYINKSYGINVAKLAGLPEEVINDAKSMLSNLSSKHSG